MASETITLRAAAREIAGLVRKIRADAVIALRSAIQVVRDNVRDLTPRWKDRLIRAIATREEDGGNTQAVVVAGDQKVQVVAHVMEANPPAVWTKYPPHAPLVEWVESKLGLSGEAADRAAWAIRANIKRRGIAVPLTHDQRGGMFRRTYEKMLATAFHFRAFATVFKALGIQSRGA